MAGAVVVHAIKSRQYKPGRVAQQVRNAAKRIGRKMIKEHEKTVESWENERPTFKQSQMVSPSTSNWVEISITLGGPRLGQNKWIWLNYGTEVRHALMSEDWVSKTEPGWVESGEGAGFVVMRGIKALQLPGIEAREWDIIIAEELEDEFIAEMEDAATSF